MRVAQSRGARRRALASASAAALAAAVVGVSPQMAAAQDEASGAGAIPDQIVITGSRILRRDFSAQSPLVTVARDAFENTSEVSLDQELAKLPQFGAGTSQLTAAADIQSTPTNSPGIATANLRGLGSNRTLVLLDGRRTQPANASLVVDLNTIPAGAIESVEIITGGAASTYGADAVAGVVNFKLRSDYEGVTLDAQYGRTDRQDGAQYRLSGLLGGNFDDGRGNAMLGLSYADREPVYAIDRPFNRAAWSDPNIAGGAFPNFAGAGPLSATQAATDKVFTAKGYAAGDVASSAILYFNTAPSTAGATLFSVAHGAVSGKPAPGYAGGSGDPLYKVLANGDLDSNNLVGQVSLPLERYSVFATGRYDLADALTLYGQARFDQSETSTQSAYSPAVNQWSVTVPVDAGHPVPAELAALLASRANPNAPWTLNKVLDYMGPTGLDTTTNTYELLAGAKGDAGVSDWTYDLFWSHGRTYMVNDYVNFTDLARYQALINLPNYGVVADVATGPLTNFRLGRAASCTSGLNPFVDAPISQDCKDVLSQNVKSSTDVVQDQVELDVQGKLFDGPAGEVRFAAGADWRKDEFAYSPDSSLATTNIVSHTIGLFDTTATGGSVGVSEVYGEVLAPLLRDLPLVQRLDVNAGYRYSEYDTATGGVDTWKITGDWEVSGWLTLRGGYQLATRAPNVAELFQPPTFLTVAWPEHDPCSNITRAPYGNVASNPDRAKVQALCTALAGGFVIDSSYVGNVPTFFPLGRDEQVGNPDLDPEEADTFTAGAVIRSPFDVDGLRRLTLAVDYYDISIDGAIQVKGTALIYQDCFNANGANPSYDPNFSACKQIIRSNANGFWLANVAEFSNLGSIETSGVDAQLEWSADLPDFAGAAGTAFANVGFNWVDKYDVQNTAGGQVFHYADSSGSPNGAQFEWKLFTTAGVSIGPATASVSWRHLPEVRNVALVTNAASTALPTKKYDLFDVSGRWAVNDTVELRAGVDNVLDVQPPRVGITPGVTTAAGTTDPASYDVLGRRFYVGATARF